MVASTLMTKTLRQMTASAAIGRSRNIGVLMNIGIKLKYIDKQVKHLGDGQPSLGVCTLTRWPARCLGLLAVGPRRGRSSDSWPSRQSRRRRREVRAGSE